MCIFCYHAYMANKDYYFRFSSETTVLRRTDDNSQICSKTTDTL